jgi:hypothetical protein
MSHSFVVVEITKVGEPTDALPEIERERTATKSRFHGSTGPEWTVPAKRFHSWRDAEQYFLGLGADAEAVEKSAASLKKTSLAVLTIV